MSPVPVPSWNAKGVLPPINPSKPASPERSPYVVSLTDFVFRFGFTPERRRIVAGFLRYRAALHDAGLTRGFQWLDGSFLENVEVLESRAPNDIDVVTFYYLPAGQSQKDLAAQFPDLLRASRNPTYEVDAYIVHLGMAPELLTEWSVYWYGVWSHRRNQVWKGFVQIDLAPADDATAMTTLANLGSQGTQP